MPKPTYIGRTSKIHQTEQEMGNQSYDSLFEINTVEPLQYVPAGASSPASLVRPLSYAHTTRLDDTTTPGVIYIGRARIGEDTAEGVWQIQKIDYASGMVITWADGDGEFDNTWDNRSSLTYA